MNQGHLCEACLARWRPGIVYAVGPVCGSEAPFVHCALMLCGVIGGAVGLAGALLQACQVLHGLAHVFARGFVVHVLIHGPAWMWCCVYFARRAEGHCSVVGVSLLGCVSPCHCGEPGRHLL